MSPARPNGPRAAASWRPSGIEGIVGLHPAFAALTIELWHTYKISGHGLEIATESHSCCKEATFRTPFWLQNTRDVCQEYQEGLMPTIALVDDDRNILTSVSIALEAEGYRIMTYTDGASALDGFKTSPPDLAILDIKMPRMDGMETLRRLRQKIRHPGDLPDLQGRGDRRIVRPQDGRRRFHPQTVLAAPAGRARQGGAAPRRPEGRRATPKETDPPRRSSAASCAWTRNATPAPGRASR